MSWSDVKDKIGIWITGEYKEDDNLVKSPPPIFGVVRSMILVGIIFYALCKLEPTIPDDAEKIGEAVSAQLFQILFILIVLGGAVGAGVYQYMSTALNEKLDNKIRDAQCALDKQIKDAKSELNGQISFSFHHTQAMLFASLSNSWWDHYVPAWINYSDPKYDKKITKETNIFKSSEHQKAKTEVRIARLYAERGLARLKTDTLEKVDVPDGLPTIDYVHIVLKNNYVYHKTAESILHNIRFDETTKSELIQYAEDLLNAANQPQYNHNWYELYETAGFVLYKNGHDCYSTRGKKILQDLCNRINPPNSWCKMPDDEWCKNLKDRCERCSYYNVPIK